MNTKYKKGDISVTILVIGVLLLSGFAMVSFFVSDFKLSNSFVGVSALGEMNGFLDEYEFYKNFNVSQETIEGHFSEILLDEGNRSYFYLEKRYSGLLGSGEGELIFTIKTPLR